MLDEKATNTILGLKHINTARSEAVLRLASL